MNISIFELVLISERLICSLVNLFQISVSKQNVTQESVSVGVCRIIVFREVALVNIKRKSPFTVSSMLGKICKNWYKRFLGHKELSLLRSKIGLFTNNEQQSQNSSRIFYAF